MVEYRALTNFDVFLLDYTSNVWSFGLVLLLYVWKTTSFDIIAYEKNEIKNQLVFAENFPVFPKQKMIVFVSNVHYKNWSLFELVVLAQYC